jgi:hypothetical protein
MDTKTTLMNKLKDRLRTNEYALVDTYIEHVKGIVSNNKNEIDVERMISWRELADDWPAYITMARKVLQNCNVQYPISLSNANDNNKFEVYRFLQKMNEPSSMYFKDGSDLTVTEYIAMKYDEYYPSKENGFDWEVYYEGADLYRSAKRNAIEDLLEAFTRRGTVVPEYNKKHDMDSISKTMTQTRYEYLMNIAKAFNKNPQSKEVIDFVIELPGNTWGDDSIFLSCDNLEKFAELERKYLK